MGLRERTCLGCAGSLRIAYRPSRTRDFSAKPWPSVPVDNWGNLGPVDNQPATGEPAAAVTPVAYIVQPNRFHRRATSHRWIQRPGAALFGAVSDQRDRARQHPIRGAAVADDH